jgi:hypothetical protein
MRQDNKFGFTSQPYPKDLVQAEAQPAEQKSCDCPPCREVRETRTAKELAKEYCADMIVTLQANVAEQKAATPGQQILAKAFAALTPERTEEILRDVHERFSSDSIGVGAGMGDDGRVFDLRTAAPTGEPRTPFTNVPEGFLDPTEEGEAAPTPNGFDAYWETRRSGGDRDMERCSYLAGRRELATEMIEWAEDKLEEIGTYGRKSEHSTGEFAYKAVVAKLESME